MKTCSKCRLSKDLSAFYKDGVGFRAECKACTLVQRDAYYAKNKPAILKQRKMAYGPLLPKKTPLTALERMRIFRAKNLELVRARDRARRPQKRESDRVYYAKFPEKAKVRSAKYHQRSRNAVGFCTAEQMRARFAFFGDCCAYCGSSRSIAADHVIPISRGGSLFPANIRPACTSCNSSKGAKKLSEWKPDSTKQYHSL